MKLSIAIGAFLCVCTSAIAAESMQDYADPGGAFAIQMPAAWKAQRKQLGQIGWLTSISAGDRAGTEVEFVAIPVQPQQNTEQTARVPFTLALGDAQQNGEIVSQKLSSTKISGLDAIRCDLVFRQRRNAPAQSGYMLCAIGRKYSVLASFLANQSDDAAHKSLDAAFATLALESDKPRSVAVTGGANVADRADKSLLDTKTMALAAERIKGNLKRDSADAVLVAGDPPLTHGSVAAFANLLSYVFDIQLTEAEFEMTQQRFIEFYNKNDAEGKKIIALGGQSILSGIQKGTDEEKARNKAEVKAVFADRISNGAKAGIGWAVVLNDAIQRRSVSLKTTSAEKPKSAQADAKKTFTSADLEASLELLYFMWVASGRDASLVTPQAIAQVRQALVVNFDKFSPDFQYVLCNAEKVYAQVRGAYQNADATTRAANAQQFGKALNDLGLTIPKKGGSAWDDCANMSESELRAQTAANYAWSSVNSTSFSGRSLTW